MAPSSQSNVFITYNDPSELKSRQNRRAVSSFASKSYRPTSRKIVLGRNQYRPFVRRSENESPSQVDVPKAEKKPTDLRKRSNLSENSEQNLLHPLNERLLGNPRTDALQTYPIPALGGARIYIPFLVDYFIRYLTPRFSPALAVETSRYLIWFNVAMHHPELFHALIALSQVYYDVDVKGFGSSNLTALYHRGEALAQLRRKVETAKGSDDDAAILTTIWLMDVDVAHGDFHAYAMHKRAKERMVANRGGIRQLNAELQDELLKSEFFLPLLLHGRFVCEVTEDDEVLVRFKENNPVQPTQVGGVQGLFSVIASKRLVTSQAVDILQRIFRQLSMEPQFARSGDSFGDPDITPRLDQAYNEMSRVLRITDEVGPKSLHHRLLLALLIYIFNFHNQPQALPPAKAASSLHRNIKIRHPYLEILSKVALELSQPTNPSDPNKVTEREVTLWTMVAIASASSFSPWRLEIPFMGHMIEWMENDEDAAGQITTASEATNSPLSRDNVKSPTNLEKLTACLRGYYLYGADKNTLRGLQQWKDDESRDPV
ncbi:hypothetical protein H2200_007801 [Cladophialophora chaetospira]|uniref:Uncharacterized protein n=1 Tax=Cladophialophora chaetospira TaxID=386627 RepID=A0AA39CGX9_9EURO|nr:hypothetical protein H2200_007801 [Cladophialophora chaetospira]